MKWRFPPVGGKGTALVGRMIGTGKRQKKRIFWDKSAIVVVIGTVT